MTNVRGPSGDRSHGFVITEGAKRVPSGPSDLTDSQRTGTMPAADINELVLLDAVELSWKIRHREVSCVEVMRAFLEHIDRFNPMVNAIVSRASDDFLLREAERRDEQLERGTYSGWMHGFPIAVKDLADAEGFPTTSGSPLFTEQIASHDERFVQRMRAAGAIVIGKTNVPEFGLGSHTFNPIFGTTTNPYDNTRTAGGSSGGAAAALAMRMLPVADGSDFMGSLRNPAAFCNVLGLRPSFGRVASEGFLSEPSVIGPMGRTARDTAMLLSTLAGPDERAPLSIEQDPAMFAEPLERKFAGARIGWVGDFDGYLPTEPGILDLCRSAFPPFEELGCVIEPVATRLPVENAWATFRLWRHWMIGKQLFPLYEQPALRAALKPELIAELEGFQRLRVDDITRALDGRDQWRSEVSKLFERYDFLLAPSTQVFPFDSRSRWPGEIAGRPMDTYHRWMEVVAPWTLSGHPTINVPVGFNDAGLPTGVQLIAPSHDELSLLQLAHGYEQLTDWVHRALPPALR